MAFYTTTPLAGFNPTDTFSSLTSADNSGHAVTLGTEIQAQDANGNTATFRFVLAGTAITQYDFLGIDENNAASALTAAMADDGWDIGVSQIAVTSGYYFWATMRGNGLQGRLAGTTAADAALYCSTTAGVLEDGLSTSSTKIDGVVAVAANTLTSASNFEVLLTYPRSSTF